MKKNKKIIGLLVLLLIAGVTSSAFARNAPKIKAVILATTTSTQDTGLLDVLVPDFEAKTGYQVKTIAVGTGQVLAMGSKGEADVLLVHAPDAEKPLVEKELAINYRLVMHNDFVVVGPTEDPAKVKGMDLSTAVFKKIAEQGAIFVSRGDNSGTNMKEIAIWKNAGIKPEGNWYQESGSGMGATLLIASEKKGYTLTDRGTYLAQKKNIQLEILVEGEKNLLNIYHVMQVNPKKFPKVNEQGARAFVKYMVSSKAQKIIAEFGREKFGQPLFFPDARKKETELGK